MSFGGSVKLTGEDSYKKALQSITQSLKVVSAEMKATASAFDNGDKSQKQLANDAKALKASLETQKGALSDLKNQLAQMVSEYSKTEAKHKELISQYDREKSKLAELARTLGTSSNEYKEQEKTVAKLEQEVQKSAKAYETQGKAVNDMKVKTANAETTINQTAKALDNLGKEAEESGKQAEKGSDGYTVMKNVLANLATQAVTMAISALQKLGQTFVDVGKQSMEAYARYEQLEGGVKKMFGTTANSAYEYAQMTGLSIAEAQEEFAKHKHAVYDVMQNAQEAYKTAGMSANEYMETVTNFSASLLQGLGGDTSQAVKYADMAIRDMADNANTFGTSLDSIQNAYQGFAKGNFTMLDNLKLGYGGTKTEMLRLVKDAGVVEESVKSLDDVSFDQMIQAIHIVQQELSITGTTAKEASGTIEGATGSMKSAWENLLTGMANEDADISKLTSNLINTLITPDGKGGVLGTMIPRISTVISGMGEALTTGIPALISAVVPVIQKNLPLVLSAVGSVVKSIIKMLPETMPLIKDFISQAFSELLDMTPELIKTGVELIVSLINGIVSAIPMIRDSIPTVIDTCLSIINENLPLLIDAGISLIMAVVEGISSAIPVILQKLPEVISSILGLITSELPKVLKMGEDILNALISGILSAIPILIDMLPTLIETIVSFITDNLPVIIKSGLNLLNSLISGIVSAIPMLVKMLPTIIDTVVTVLLDNLPYIISCGFDLLIGVIDGILSALPDLVEMLPSIVVTIVSTIIKELPKILELGGKILWELIKGIGKVVVHLGVKIYEVTQEIIKKLKEGIQKVPEIGENLVKGLWNGIKNTTQWILDKIAGFGQSVMDGIKNIFGIKSPSRLMRDEVGKNLALGIGVGFEDEMKNVTKQMQDSVPTSFDTTITTGSTSNSNVMKFDEMVSAFKEALGQMKVEMDDEEMGKFVDKTVSRLVYT